VGIKSAPATIVTAYDPSSVSAFASTASDFLVKPFDAERFEAALYFKCELLPKFVSLTTAIAQAKFMSLPAMFITSINGSARALSGEALSIS
jgi:DNA-binding LytR/AlgR family response regulator